MSKSALSQRWTHWPNSRSSMFTRIPASPSCCWTICAMSLAYTGSVVWVRIVRLTGPTPASWSSWRAFPTSRR